MKKIIIFLFFIFFNNAYAEKINKYFHIGLMESYDKKFTLYFKTREKAIIAKGGILIALSKKYKIPIVGLGLGEKEDDLQIFNAKQFASAFTQKL